MNTNKEAVKKSVGRFGLFLLMYLGMSVAATTCLASSIVLQWDANTESDLAGYKVYYQANSSTPPFDGAGAIQGVAPVDVANQTTATISGLDPGTDYYFAVTAYNTSGMESPYSNIVAIPGIKDITPPTVSITSPAAGANINGVVAITATASDDVGVTKVEYYENGTLMTAGNVPPYAYNWDTRSLPSGNYTLTAKAYDAAGNTGISNVVVTVDTIAPTVGVTTPASGTTVSGTVNVTANATDNVGVTRVEFYVNGALQTTTTSAPYSFNWNTTALAKGSYTLSAKAYDPAGNVAQSTNVAVAVSNDATAPTITFLAPTLAYVYGTSTTVSASATDNLGVARMELYIDGLLNSSTNSNSFSVPVAFTKGVHTITVKAYDSSNNVASATKSINRIY